MARTKPVEVLKKDTFEEFLNELRRPPRSHVRLVKVDDQGLVEPARRGNAFVMQPMARVVATAYDNKAHQILLWERKKDVGSGIVTIDAFTGRGRHRDVGASHTKDEVIGLLQVEGYQVASGEWTSEDVEHILARSKGF